MITGGYEMVKIKEAVKIATSMATIVGTVVTAAQPAKEALDERNEKRKDYVEIPTFYGKDFSVSLDKAQVMLEKIGLVSVSAEITKPSMKYNDEKKLVVIKTIPHAKKKVAPGSTVTISYLTESVIKESQKLFDEQEKQKHIKEQNRLEKSAKSKEKRAESFSTIHEKFSNTTKTISNKTKVISSKILKKDKITKN